MSIVKKYNPTLGKWEVVAASSASQISVRSEQLLPEGQKETDVESVLQRLDDDITTLKGNVSWLAEHGGGGSGSGSGSGGPVDGEIKVNGHSTGATIILDSSGLSISVQSKSSNVKWDITVASGSKIIKTINDVSKTAITTQELQKAGLTSSFNLSITAFNEDSLSNLYWDGHIQISTVNITTSEEVSFKFTDLNKSQIVYNYDIGVLGTYTLYINDVQIGDPYTFVYTSGQILVNLSDIVSSGVPLQVGSNSLIARLQSAQTAEIKSADCPSRIILTAESPIISCPTLSEDPNYRTDIFINTSQNTVLLVPYTVYYISGAFKSQIYLDESEKVAWENINQYNYYNTSYPNTSYTITTKEVGVNIQITIAILDSRSQVEYTKTFYGITKEPNYELLEIGTSPIFNFQTFFGNITNNQWKADNGNATMTIMNPNNKSISMQADNNLCLRLQNASYGIIQNKGNLSYYNDYFTDAIKQFTLSICYKADFHPDDDRTVLQFASLDTEHLPESGILIRDHKLYIAKNTYDLEDQELMTITITYRQIPNTNQGSVFVYINGVVETVFENVTITDLIPQNENKIYIAAQVYNKQESQFTDLDIYRVSLYKQCLNPLQVLYEYLNDQAFTHLIENKTPDSEAIEKGLQRNFINKDEEGNLTSLLYNVNQDFDNNSSDFNGNFSLQNLISVSGSNVDIRNDISNYKIPIPLMLIDVSKSASWTWRNFITPNFDPGTVEACSFQYYDQNGSYQGIIKGSCDVNIQGTSTLSDVIKNLSITFADGTIFIPKETWFPEKEYGLKADIVDSSHSINTSIGKFVNTELGFKYKPDGSFESTESWYPYSETVSQSFISQKNNPSSAIAKYFPKATLKHGVEGFPIFLLVKFKGETDNDAGIHTMGIYQFILGRKSPRNLGYQIITNIDGSNASQEITDTTKFLYPYYNENVQISYKENKGYWIEVGVNDSFGDSFKFQEKDSITDEKFTGLFWQADEGGSRYKDPEVLGIKYQNVGASAVSLAIDFPPMKQFIRNIIALPVTNRRYCLSGSDELQRHTFYNTTYPVYTSKTTSSGIIWEKQEGSNQIYNSGDDLEGVLKQLNISSYAQYFVLCMLFGLIDNFEKNMPIKFYQKANGEWEVPILGIYDTDTGLGGDNEGILSVSEAVWLSTLENVKGAIQETSTNFPEKKTHIIGQNNKLWFFDSEAVNYSLGYGKEGSLFTAKWNSFIRHLQNNYNSGATPITKLEDLVSVYYNNYFIPQTEGCGELLFNLTYFTKYLNKYESNGSYINQSNKLHGRRQQQVRKWMKNRVKFLDSMFQAMGSNTSMGGGDATQVISSMNVSLTTGLAPTFKISSNYPIVSKITHQGSNKSFVMIDENNPTPINWGSDSPVSQSYDHSITYSDSIQNLGDSEQSLKDLFFVKVNNGALPYLTVFDANNCATLGSSSDAVNAFKSGGKSELREIDLSNTAKTGSTINYVLNLTSGFEKLQKLNLYNSCVSKIQLPEGSNNIPLLFLDIRYSQLTSLDLSYQNLLTSLDLTGCHKISRLNINNCNNITSLSLNATQSNLKTLSINSDAFQSLDCIGNDSIQSIDISSSNLRTVNLTDCSKLQSLTVSGDKLDTLILKGCESLIELNITYSKDNPKDSIGTLDLSKTKLTYIKYNNVVEDESILDLSRYVSIENFNIQDNNSVEYIQFRNVEETPIKISNPFRNTNLKRVYGNLNIETSRVFAGCTNFSILGPDQTYLGVSMVDTDGRVKHFTEVSSICEDSKPKFQTGQKVTNLNFISNNGQNNFYNTKCTILDIYYVFYNIGNLTNCSQIFDNLHTTLFGWSSTCDNSPNRNMFINCQNVKDLSYCFYRCNFDSAFRLFSPTNDGNSIIEDNGLFSPLVNVTTVYDMFNNHGTYGDRFQFRRKIGNYKLNNFGYWNIALMVDNINDLSSPPSVNSSFITSNYETIGNFNLFFQNLPNVSSLFGFAYNTLFINYGLTDDLSCPATDYKGSFYSTYASGDIQLSKLFSKPSEVTTINTSFVATTSLDVPVLTQATFKITEEMFNDFTNLIHLGYISSGSFTGNGLYTSSFCGSGLTRTINQNTFPYGIFNNCPKLQSVTGFFQNIDASKSDLSEDIVSLPGTLFERTPDLVSVAGLFMNFAFNFQLNPLGFKNCPKLQYVPYLFSGGGLKFTGHIPNKFFYHGGKDVTITYTGANLWNEDKSGYRYDPLEITQEGTQIGINEEDIQEISITYHDPYKTITSMHNCFAGCNIAAYQNAKPEIENNPDYLPLTHIIKNGVVQKAVFNDLQKTIIWEYDGHNIPEGFIGENLDENYNEQETIGTSIQYNEGWSITSTLNYICAPDLFRYCNNINNLSIYNIFKECGYSSNYSIRWVSPQIKDYGLKGRIVPYLLKPISNVSSIQGMFFNCSLLSPYVNKEGIAYVIPQTFFSYAPKITDLSQAFYGTTYPQNINLAVFNSLTGALNITKIFMYCRFNGTPNNKAVISNVFQNKQIVALERAFSVNNSYTGQSDNNIKRDQYVRFDSNFTKNKIAKNADQYVFDGYSSDTVEFVKSLEDRNENYRTYNRV